MDIHLVNHVKVELFVDICEELKRRGISGGWMANAKRAEYTSNKGTIMILCQGLEVDVTVRSSFKTKCEYGDHEPSRLLLDIATAYNHTFNIADPESFNKIVDWIVLRHDS